MPDGEFDRLQVSLRESPKARRILSEFDIYGRRRVIWSTGKSVWSFNECCSSCPATLTVIAGTENELASTIRRVGALMVPAHT